MEPAPPFIHHSSWAFCETHALLSSTLTGLTGTLSSGIASVPSFLGQGTPMSVTQLPASSVPALAVAPSMPKVSTSVVSSVLAVTAASTAAEAPEDLVLPASGLPPIPAHLVQSIKAGKFVDFGELLPEALREAVFETMSGQKEDKKKKKEFMISSLADWGLAFAIFSAVTSTSSLTGRIT